MDNSVHTKQNQVHTSANTKTAELWQEPENDGSFVAIFVAAAKLLVFRRHSLLQRQAEKRTATEAENGKKVFTYDEVPEVWRKVRNRKKPKNFFLASPSQDDASAR